MPAGKALRYDFNGFTWVSRRVSKGSRLRLADETAKDARTAHVILYHDAEHLSALEIPIVR